MRNYAPAFYSLMDEAGIMNSGSFDAYIEDVLGYGNTQALYLQGFTFEPEMQLNFDYEQLQLTNNLYCMATYTDKDSEAIPFGNEGFTSSRGVIPRQKAREVLDEDDYRKYLITMSQMPFTGGTAREYALNLLFTKLNRITQAHNTTMTYQRDQMVSAGAVTLSMENNPRGIKGITFSASVPPQNVTTLIGENRWWTDTAKTVEGTNSDPVTDFMQMINKLYDKYGNAITVEVDEVSFLQDMNHSKWRMAFGYMLNPNLNYDQIGQDTALNAGRQLFNAQLKEMFMQKTGINVVFRNNLAAVETVDPDTRELVVKQMRSFKPNTYVFYPSGGSLGTIKTVAPLRPDNEGLYGTILGGRGTIKYDYNVKTMVQDWWSELTCLCVPNRSREMFYLNIM